MTRQSPNHMEARKHPKGSLEYFPTPPWATRALLHEILQRRLCLDLSIRRAREPNCGEGHMVVPLQEAFGQVDYSDIADWGINPPIRDFTFETRESLEADGLDIPDWIIMNPPFEPAAAFCLRALDIANEGLAMFIRLGWLPGQDRYHRIFAETPPTIVGIFSERVALIEGAWDPEASTATDYVWAVWKHPLPLRPDGFQTVHFPPGMQDRYTKLSDERLAKRGEAKRRAEARKRNQAGIADVSDIGPSTFDFEGASA